MFMAEEGVLRSRLGRGLAALIGDVGDEATVVERTRGQRRVPIEFLRPNPRNPRRNFSDDELDSLAASIRERGIIQPILVRTIPSQMDAYEIIAGERRWRAAQRVGQHEVPVLLMEVDDRGSLEIAIVENVQRTDLNAVEEALGYQQLIADFGHSQGELAQIIGKSRSHVANTLRLLALPEEIKDLMREGKLSAGHGRALLSLKDAHAAARRIVAHDLSVRDVERMVQEEADGETPERRPAKAKSKSPDHLALEKRVSEALGLTVSITDKGGAGELTIKYKTWDQLDDVCRRLITPITGAVRGTGGSQAS
jgi:ParB family transcriptional regulator, chromosome partitioning protein